MQDVSQWKGQHAYIEILDNGDEYAAVDRICFSDDGPPAEGPNPLIVQMLGDAGVTSAELLKEHYVRMFNATVEQWVAGELGKSAAPGGVNRHLLRNRPA